METMEAVPPLPNHWLDVASASSYTHLGKSYIYRAIRRGDLKAIKVGTRTLLTREEVDRWIESYR